MASKRDVLGALNRAELLAFVDKAGVEVADRRKRELLIDALAASKRARLLDHLQGYSRARLQELCVTLGLTASGRDKAGIVERIVGSGAGKASVAKTRTAAIQ